MENSLACVFKSQYFCSSVLQPSRKGIEPSSIRFPSNYGILRQNNKRWKAVVMNCGKGDSVSEVEKKRVEEELIGFGRLEEKCKETVNGGTAELLECLEREAIMGGDEGKEPTDYNRRAQIFNESSRVFQALKETTTPTGTS